MQLFSAVGPLGAGKTTFVLNLIRALESRGFPTKERFAYVINDEGGFADGELARKSAEVVAMTNGCFTCSDTADLKRVLSKLEHSGITWVFLEGFGITAGGETRRFLESCKYPFHILCLLSAKHHALDLIRYADVVKSQVKAATLAVGITKYQGKAGQFFDHLLSYISGCTFARIVCSVRRKWILNSFVSNAGVAEFVARENPGIPLVFIPNDSGIPDIIIDIFEEEKQIKHSTSGSIGGIDHQNSHKHGKNCGCGHQGHRDLLGLNKVHDMYPYSYELKQESTLDSLRKVFRNKPFLLRVKGAVGGYLFNEVHGDWQQTLKDDRRFVTFYSSREVDVEVDLPGLTMLVAVKEEIVHEEPSYMLIRKETSTREETVQEIKALLRELPIEPIVISSRDGIRIITHPEKFQNVKEISRRPYVVDEWFPQVLKRFMQYWIKCADIVNNRSKEIIPEDIAKNLYELAVSMVWWLNRHREFFGTEIAQAVERLHPGAMAADGIVTIRSLIEIMPQETVSWQCLEFTEALSYGLVHGESAERMIGAARHCLSLATTHELKQAWLESIKRLEKESSDALA